MITVAITANLTLLTKNGIIRRRWKQVHPIVAVYKEIAMGVGNNIMIAITYLLWVNSGTRQEMLWANIERDSGVNDQ